MTIATLSGTRGEFTYEESDPADKKRAWMAFAGITSEEYDAREQAFRDSQDELAKKYPALKNLVWVDGEMYYTDDAGVRLSGEMEQAQLSRVLDQMRDSLLEVAGGDDTIMVNGISCSRTTLLKEELDKLR